MISHYEFYSLFLLCPRKKSIRFSFSLFRSQIGPIKWHKQLCPLSLAHAAHSNNAFVSEWNCKLFRISQFVLTFMNSLLLFNSYIHFFFFSSTGYVWIHSGSHYNIEKKKGKTVVILSECKRMSLLSRVEQHTERSRATRTTQIMRMPSVWNPYLWAEFNQPFFEKLMIQDSSDFALLWIVGQGTLVDTSLESLSVIKASIGTLERLKTFS